MELVSEQLNFIAMALNINVHVIQQVVTQISQQSKCERKMESLP